MKKILLMIIALTFFSINANAKETKIAYVDFKKAVSECDQGKAALAELEKLIGEKKEVIDAKGREIKKLDEEITKQASVLTQESLKKKQEERDKMIKEYQRMVKDTDEELQKKEVEYVQKISAEVKEILDKIGKEENYTAILEMVEGGILYMPKELDLTDTVIKRLNEDTAAKTKK
ncbi:MAG: OmpH family outer membrane protein [Nitrospirae bacterium]|nr:OmpH family outer membrane protein [Nitrospirota bacterium]